MICREKRASIQKLSTNSTQIGDPFPQGNAQYVVVDIRQIRYILCLLVLNITILSSPARHKTGNQIRLAGLLTCIEKAVNELPANTTNRITTRLKALGHGPAIPYDDDRQRTTIRR
ncbi:hypothetical protein A3195_04330 [Candidatus Thiodiazotropha endoloripes]|uniref:Uncharacterized protein n=1 Tax=Candidatus Thiodiazotropha endoloripes TaxID=1818881 RepID=A0A1E2UL32_9GAMM|nr:hypothetical protein A3193_12660 [Candidatus Thiodiazotropha endoloripes]ODB90693.1 hypothetical protein A3195_04330 [Candidatus Thiodiazotropha endoloripes]ODB94079.1 hypothetical protein A3194_05315 [Candidatus Thiodiazotropha endoloripes]ODB95401.1 hypothetical protein A3196_00690 [Candidatus Thiodiazotropha endoloripes]